MDSRLSPDTLHSVTKPETSYVIAASPRSGSNLLCEALWLAGAGRPDEYFLYWYMSARDPEGLKNDFAKPWLVPPAEYVEKVLEKGTTPNGVFGVKIMGDCFQIVIDNLRTIPRYRDLAPPAMLEAVFPNLRYVYMSRQDKARQAVSLAKAIQSRKWIELHSRVFDEKRDHLWGFDRIQHYTAKVGDARLAYDFDQIALLHEQVVRQDEGWETYFDESGIEPFRVVYEEYVQAYERTARDLVKFLGVAASEESTVFEKRAMRQQSDAVNEEWTQRYKEELESRSS